MSTDPLFDRLQHTFGAAYSIERELGGGGMSRVFVAEETRLGRRVVVKVLSPELAAGVSARRFEQEITLAAQLQQANIVPVITAGEMREAQPERGDGPGLPYYMMPFVDGLSLRARLARDGALPVADAVSVLRDVARALAYAHERGVVHRDIKPENILLSGDAAVVTDFGIAKALAAARGGERPEGAESARDPFPGTVLTAIGTSLGTPAYMAPEQAAGDPATDHRADLYALGCVAYEMLTGAAPFAGRPVHQLFAAHLNETPAPLLPRLPVAERREPRAVALAQLVARCLEKDPARRPQSAREVLQGLDGVSTGPGSAEAREAARGRKHIAIVGLAAVGLALASIAGFALSRRPEPQAEIVDRRSVAVLPLVNASGDTASEYFADGMTDELTNALARVPGLHVASRTSSFAFRGRHDVDAREIARRLGVANLLEGTVRRQGEQLRVTAQLTNAADGQIVWSDRFDGDTKDVFRVQDEMARGIAARLRVALGDSLGRAGALATPGTTKLEAHDLYLRARYLLNGPNGFTLEAGRRALELYQEALRLDPKYALPYTGISAAYQQMADFYLPPREAYPKAREAALRALAIDSTLAEAHAELGSVAAQYDWDHATAERELLRALALDPNSADALQTYALLLTMTQRFDSAIVVARRAAAVDPLSHFNRIFLALSLTHTGHAAEAEAHLRGALRDSPDEPMLHLALGWAVMLESGRLAEARSEIAKATVFPIARGLLGHTLARMGQRDSALAVARDLERERTQHYLSGDYIAMVYAGLGDRDETMRWLEQAYRDRAADMMALWMPIYDQVRDDPRFQALARRVATGVHD